MIRIMLDTSSDCLPGESYCDSLIPIAIQVDGREYMAGQDIDNDAFYGLLERSSGFPRTSQPAPQTFIDAFEAAQAAGDDIIYFAPSSALSGTYQCACLARDMVGYSGVHIVDTRAASHMVSLMARFARKLSAQGEKVDAIVQKCAALRERIRLVVGVDTLEYLRRSGRMSGPLALIGELTKIRPVITITPEGAADAAGKCLGRSRAIQFIVNRLKQSSLDPAFPLCSLYSYGTANCEQLEKKLQDAGFALSRRLQIGSTIGAHAGPGVYGVLYVTR